MAATSPTPHHLGSALEKVVEVGLAGESEQNAAQPEMTSPLNFPAAAPMYAMQHPTNSHSPSGSVTRVGSHTAAEDEKPADLPEVADTGLLTGVKLFTVFISLMFCVFMFALDQSIVSTAIPTIVSDFHAFTQVSWIVTGYFLTQCGLILLVGQLLTVVKAKWMLLSAIFFFELGSLICAVSKSMGVLIFARAVQGIGASGMFVSILAVIAVITRIEQRSAFMASFGFVFVISSVVGPLLGGVFTQHVSWRLCFWINLPFGVLAAVAVVFLLPAREPSVAEGAPRGRQALKRIDYVGSAFILTTITCLLLALQWGGNEYPWGSWRIILLFVLGGILAIGFGFWEYRMDKTALIPRAILSNRTGLAASGSMFFFMLAMLGGTYQLPLFYQAGRGHSAEKSGIDIIPFMLSVCIGIFISGGLVTKFGRYYPFPPVGAAIAAVGFGLLYTIRQTTSNATVIGYQILAGFGVGLAFQNALISIQAEYHDRPYLLPQATSVVSFAQLSGGALGIGIINTVQSVYLNTELKALAPSAPFETVRQSVSAIFTLPADLQEPVITAYIIAITRSFIPIFVAIAIAFVVSLFIRNHNMLQKGGMGGAAAV